MSILTTCIIILLVAATLAVVCAFIPEQETDEDVQRTHELNNLIHYKNAIVFAEAERMKK